MYLHCGRLAWQLSAFNTGPAPERYLKAVTLYGIWKPEHIWGPGWSLKFLHNTLVKIQSSSVASPAVESCNICFAGAHHYQGKPGMTAQAAWPVYAIILIILLSSAGASIWFPEVHMNLAIGRHHSTRSKVESWCISSSLSFLLKDGIAS